MRLSRCWGQTRRETLAILQNDIEEYIWQIAANQVDPFPDFNELAALLFETQVQQPKRLFNHTRHLPPEHPLRQQTKKPMTSEQVKLYVSQIT